MTPKRNTSKFTSSHSQSYTLRHYLPAIITGLLSSSCCIIQLALNALSISCAGFSVLSPYRPFFLAITGAVIAYTIFHNGFNQRTLFTILIAVVLSASPEIVGLHNEGKLIPTGRNDMQ